MVDHEHWVALDVRETDVLRGQSDALLSRLVLGHGHNLVDFSPEREGLGILHDDLLLLDASESHLIQQVQ